jgi:hypothetical protein
MGTHEILFNRMVLPLLQGQAVSPPTGSLLFLEANSVLARIHPEGIHGGTPNFKEMSAAARLGCAAFHGSVDVAEAVARVLELKARQNHDGLWFGEQLAPDPHTLFHLSSRILETLAAIKLNHAELLTAMVTEWSSWLGTMRSVATADGEVFSPCSRFWNPRHGVIPHFEPADGTSQGPGHQIASAALRVLLGLPHQGPARRPPFWADPVWGAGIARLGELIGPGRPLHNLTPRAGHLGHQLVVHRSADGHLATIQGPVVDDEAWCDWIAVQYVQPTHHRVTGYGVNWKTPPPNPPDGSTTTHSI